MPKSKPLYMLLTGRFKLAYSRQRDDSHKVYGLYVFKPHFLDIIAARCTKDIEEAKKRVTITSDGKYMYDPSDDYIQFAIRHKQFKSLKITSHGDRT